MRRKVKRIIRGLKVRGTDEKSDRLKNKVREQEVPKAEEKGNPEYAQRRGGKKNKWFLMCR